MHVWIVVVALLALAVFFLFISLFLKDNQYEDELDELSEGLLELNREVYSLKKKIQELEGTPIYRAPVEQAPQPEPEFTFIHNRLLSQNQLSLLDLRKKKKFNLCLNHSQQCLNQLFHKQKKSYIVLLVNIS